MKKIIIAVFLISLILLLSGCIQPKLDCYSGRECNDGNECTIDSCDSGSCRHTNTTDGTACTNGSCKEGKCVASASFKQSTVLYDISEETGKPDQYYCSYDESRNKIAIIIKQGGIYDSPEIISKTNDYFTAVKNHLNIDNAGVKKFNGTSIQQLDELIENLVKNEYVGYVIFVGADLPIVKTEENRLILDLQTINDRYEYVGRIRDPANNNCIDAAISSVFAPESYSDEQKRNFIVSVFSNFVNYHNNPKSAYDKYQGILAVDWNNSLPREIGVNVGGNLDPKNHSEYRKIYFYPVNYVLNTEFGKIHESMKNKLLFFYEAHGNPTAIGIGLTEPPSTEISTNGIYTDLEELSTFTSKNGQPSLFVGVFLACDQDVLAVNINASNNAFCCWPQEWLKTGAWAMTTVFGDPYHHNFQRWAFTEKIIGKALRKTYHTQDSIYGDILGTFP